VSHEIRTPMNAILGFSQLLRHDPGLTASQRRQLDVINSSGEHLLHVINDVLEMSKIEAGSVTANPAAFDLHALLDELESMFGLRAQDKGLALTVTRSPDVPCFVITDESKLRQVFVNLLANAVKFTEAGVVTLAAEGERSAVTIKVVDTGVGIRAQDLDRLFTKFTQLESTKTKRHAGTGLGLVIVKGLVGQLGGTIAVESRELEGSTFSVRLPSPRPLELRGV